MHLEYKNGGKCVKTSALYPEVHLRVGSYSGQKSSCRCQTEATCSCRCVMPSTQTSIREVLTCVTPARLCARPRRPRYCSSWQDLSVCVSNKPCSPGRTSMGSPSESLDLLSVLSFGAVNFRLPMKEDEYRSTGMSMRLCGSLPQYHCHNPRS